ncbi:MAG: helix-turn-helix transcriptional regulator [Elusimicrobia bacterium]|nr:helix-turn-helix transcriptional regulator [Elusimicrobiota bacterium]
MAVTVLGKNIKEILYLKRMSQAQLAKQVGVHKQILSKWIRGERNPKDENLERLATALDTTVKDLLKEPKKNLVLSPQEIAEEKLNICSEKLRIKDEEIKNLRERISFLEKELAFYKAAK